MRALVQRSGLWAPACVTAGAVLLALGVLAGSAQAAQGDCCQPLSTGDSPVASDCLFILQVAVGQRQCTPECICAPRGSLPTVATDALVCLLTVVGGQTQLDCPCGGSTTTSSTVTTSSSTTTTLDLTLPTDWEPAFDATDIGYMMSGWGPGDGSLWVVGGQFANGKILHQDASGWHEVDPGVSVQLLNWVHGTSRKDVFVGGYEGAILHFDGSTWRLQDTPTTEPVWGLWAVAPDDVWAVGGDNNSTNPPFVLHYDGNAWSAVTLPTLVRPGVHALFKVWGSSADDVYAVGQNGVVLHWDGSEFTELFVGVSHDLIGIWGTGPDDVLIVGGRSNAEIVHWDGMQWTKAPASALPGLNGVWMRSPSVAHAVGVAGTSVLIDPTTLATTPESVPTSLELHGVFGDAQGQLIALGANFDYPEQGVALIRGLSNDE
jgi:hypothetical protein